MKIKRLLVPTDFTEVSLSTLQNAASLAERASAKLCQLHIVESQSEVPQARRRLEAVSNSLKQDFKIDIVNIIRIGDFMESIGNVACEIDADLVLMGTHGIKGMQWITGSNAMKILTNSPVPIIINQAIENIQIKSIVVPLDFNLESRQKLDTTVKIALVNKARLHLYVKREKDEILLDKMNKMVHQVSSYISDHKLDYTLSYEDEEIDEDRLLEFSHRIGADLISIVNYQEKEFTALFSISREQHIITNKYKIPVLCVNPKPTSDLILAY